VAATTPDNAAQASAYPQAFGKRKTCDSSAKTAMHVTVALLALRATLIGDPKIKT
jgi:hypothetical protein